MVNPASVFYIGLYHNSDRDTVCERKIMSSFTEALIAKKLTARTWEIAKAFEYHVGSEDSNEVVEVPRGFVTDFASVPRIAWSIFPPDGEYSQAAVVHDYLYHIKIYTRHRTDQIFLEAMEVLGVVKWKRLTMYTFVRMFSWLFWNRRKPLIPILGMLLILLLTSCAYVSPQGRLFLGFGEYERYPDGKMKRLTSKTPLEDVVNVVVGNKE